MIFFSSFTASCAVAIFCLTLLWYSALAKTGNRTHGTAIIENDIPGCPDFSNSDDTTTMPQKTKNNPYIFDPSNGQQDKWVTLRSLHAASDLVKKIDEMDEETLTAGLEGTVGAAFTGQLMSFIRFGQQMPPVARVCDEPDTCPVPTNPTAQLVQVFQFVTQVKDKDMAEAVSTYVQRMRNEMQSMFVNTVANSSRTGMFVLSTKFSELMRENRAFFNN